MSPAKTSPGGTFRFNRIFLLYGQRVRCQLRSGARTLREFHRRDALLTQLYEDQARHELLRAFCRREVRLAELVEAARSERLALTTADLAARRPLWTEVDRVLALPGTPGSDTRIRYRTSFRHLARSGVLPPTALVSDLGRVDWVALRTTWVGSAADWNHLGRAVSAFLTRTLGDKWHPLRRQVAAAFPKLAEVERVPDLSPEGFLRRVAAVREELRPALMLVAMTGVRRKEYLALRPAHLARETHGIRVPGTKTAGAPSIVYVDPVLWPWVEAAVPAPCSWETLRAHWYAAGEALGGERVRLHDLRHCTGQWLTEAGMATGDVQQVLRHLGPAMTLRYTKRRVKLRAAGVMGQILAPGPRRRRRSA